LTSLAGKIPRLGALCLRSADVVGAIAGAGTRWAVRPPQIRRRLEPLPASARSKHQRGFHALTALSAVFAVGQAVQISEHVRRCARLKVMFNPLAEPWRHLSHATIMHAPQATSGHAVVSAAWLSRRGRDVGVMCADDFPVRAAPLDRQRHDCLAYPAGGAVIAVQL
jgi:hypothetical protein